MLFLIESWFINLDCRSINFTWHWNPFNEKKHKKQHNELADNFDQQSTEQKWYKNIWEIQM